MQKRKTIFSLVMIFVLCATILPIFQMPAKAETNTVSGTYRNVDYTINNGTDLVIGKAGETQTFSDRYEISWPWCNTDIKTVKIAGKVIGTNTFLGMFRKCNQLESIDLTNLDTKNVTDMSHMFENCVNVKILTISQLDTENVTDMSCMFYGCEKIENIDVRNFKTSKLKSTWAMFYGCKNVSNLDLTNFDTGNVTTMGGMFDGCAGLKELDLSNFDTSNVQNMLMMFEGCSNLTTVSLQNFNTSKVDDMNRMFSGCTSLKAVNLDNFNTDNVTTMSGMFKNCSGLEELNLQSFNTQQVRYMDNMFLGCYGLKRVTFGNDFSFKGNGIEMQVDQALLPEIKETDTYTGKWIDEGKTVAAVTAKEMREKYDDNKGGLAKTWVPETKQVEGTVVVHYIDESGKKLTDDVVINGIAGDGYNAVSKEIEGYEIKTSPENVSGTITKEATEVTYVY